MRLFPKRSQKEKSDQVRSWLGVVGVYALLATGGLGLFFFGGAETPPTGDGTWISIRWGGLVVGVIATLLALQSVFSLAVEATIGPERYIALFIVLGVIVGLYELLT